MLNTTFANILRMALFFTCFAGIAGDALLEGFRAPPKEAKPHVWWHWMNGNVSKAGITADLEAMASAGIGGAQIFDVSDGICPGTVIFNSDAWMDMLHHANEEAKRLGIELCLANCSGWSSSGGPWVKPADSQKNLVFSETVVKGGTVFAGNLPPPPNPHGFYRDLRVVAFPRPVAERILPADYGSVTKIEKNTRATTTFATPFPLSGVALAFKEGGRHVIAHVSVEVDAGNGFRTVVKDAEVYPMRYGFADDRIFVPVQVNGVVGLRVTCKMNPKGAKLVSMVPEARARVVEENAKTFVLRSRIAGLVNTAQPEQIVDETRVFDLTSLMSADGNLAWTVPADAEEWVVLRIGFAANGARCRPPTPGGDGLEVDKLSKAALGRFFTEGYVDRALAKLGPVSPRGGVHSLIVDSYEVLSQNWTDGMEKVFASRMGYDLTRLLPVFAGRIVGSVERTDMFLADFRAVVADLFVENYAAEFHRLCKIRGLMFYLEGYGSAPCDDLRYARHCDVPMGEFWAGKRSSSHPKADVGGILNCAWPGFISHVWGQRYAASESFTSDTSSRWNRDPFAYKAQGDRVFCAGVNRIIYHRWAHQPWTNPANYPGMTMGPHGSHFERTQTWWRDAAPVWLKYQSRCQFLLQQGTTAADLLVVASNRAPSCGFDLTRWHDYAKVAHDRFGRGVQWDLCGEDALAASKTVDGKTVVPSGAVYPQTMRLDGTPPKIEPDFDCADDCLYRDLRWIHRRTVAGDEIYFVALPNTTRTTFEVSFRQGGQAPIPGGQAPWQRGQTPEGNQGGQTPEGHLGGQAPECGQGWQGGQAPEIWEPEDGTIHAPVAWRREKGRTFVTLTFEPSGSAFVVFRKRPTEGLTAAPVPVKEDHAVAVEGPWTVTFNDGRGAPTEGRVFTTLVPWNEFEEEGIRFYSGSATYEKMVKVGKSMLGKDGRVVLDLGDVKNVAVVTVNGRTFPCLWRPPYRLDITETLGNVAHQNVPLLEHSANQDTQTLKLSIRVTNQWPNRLIGDDALPCDAQYNAQQGATEFEKKDAIVSIPERVWRGEASPTGRHTFTTWRLWRKDEPLLPSGLLGPVRLLMQ